MTPSLREALAAWYGTPGRHYHTIDHVDEVLANFESCRSLMRQPMEAYVAVLFHDAVYEVGQTDNEARSAALACEQAPRWFDVDLERVHDLIMMTASHGSHSVTDADAALFLDCDMAILGASPKRYQEYTRQIFAEWAPVVAPRDFAEGRAAFLRKVLKTRIFLSDLWHQRLESSARRNLEAELLRLSAE